MYKQEVQHRILAEVRNDFPYLKIGIRFNDYFTQDTYVLESSNRKNNLKHIPFAVYKNNELLKECALIDNNIDNFLNSIFENIEDHDLKKIFYSQNKENITKEIQDFLEFYDKLVLVNEVNLEGELRRMKSVAGIGPRLLQN